MDRVIQRSAPVAHGMREIFLAGGCFWGMQKYMESVQGVLVTDVGYANGHTPHPTYEAVCAHGTGYAETVRVVYDPKVASLAFLLSLFFKAIDPISVNRQGGDVGDQYRTGIYYLNEADRPTVDNAIAALQRQYDRPIAIEVKPLETYYLAEAYHQDYLRKNPGGYCHVSDAMCAAAASATAYAKPDDETLRRTLTPLQYSVTQAGGTEPPFANEYDQHFEPGIYVDITTGQPLFASTSKFDAGCGWPAFAKPIDTLAVTEHHDSTHGMQRTEVRSSLGSAHLGHVFADGPTQMGGLRYCINSASLRFVPLAAMREQGYGDLVALVE